MADSVIQVEPPVEDVPAEPRVVEARPATCLGVQGRGPPGTTDFHDRIDALFRLATRLQAEAVVSGHGFALGPLETLWWSDEGPLEAVPRAAWRWLHLVRIPDTTTVHDLERARQNAPGGDPVHDVRLEPLDEGTCVQAMHRGPYDEVGATYARMMAFAAREGYGPAGRVHEVYLDDPATPPADLRTVCRVPVRRLP